ncbi:aromatic ring-hydroxylating oxygenase subunit alpha [Mycobacterium sp.]|uniref:aromatic ring-hydroxylating oxygenase subunit alpha n=1 Tax=Mycobacterium sp. TaxID=1785 RepID=UPI003D6BCFA4
MKRAAQKGISRMTMTVPNGLLIDPGTTNWIPKERYTSREFFDLEMEKLWPRVWQVACREEEIPNPGDFIEYTIGDQSILLVRSDSGTIKAYFNTCPHRGTRLAADCGNFGNDEIRCRYHAWRWDLGGSIREVVDRHDFPATMTDDDVRLRDVQVGRWGGFVFVNMDPNCESLEEFLGDLPSLLRPYHFEQMRFRAYRTTIFEANWKLVIDSFNEGYHPQGTHPQMLTWYDDTASVYRQVGKHARMGHDEQRERKIGPSPRLQMSDDDYDEVELLLFQIEATSGLWSREDRARINDIQQNGLPDGVHAIDVLDDIRINGLKSRGIDLSGMTKAEILEGGDYHFFPNMVGPGAVGNFTLYRARPNGLDPDSTVMDMWALEWVAPGSDPPAYHKKFYANWREKDWGLINNQDYANYLEVQTGLKSRGCTGMMLNPVQEANLLHMHRVIDQYLTS